MLSSENAGNIHFTKNRRWTIATEKLNPHQSQKVMGVCKYPLEYITKQKKDLQNNIQEWNNILRNGYLPRNNVWTAFLETLWSIIKYVLPVTTLSKNEE